MPATYEAYAALGGRILLSIIFLLSGVMKLMNWQATEMQMAAHGMPAIPLLLALATLIEIAGGLALLLGFQTRVAALIVFLYLIPTTLIFHNFWNYQGAAQQGQLINFLKNLAIMGGLLEYSAFGAGALSMDAGLSRSRLGPVAFGSRAQRHA